MTYTAIVRHVPAHWNRIAFCNVPERWTAEVIETDLPRGMAIYSDGCQSKQEAIADLIASFKARGMHGKLRVVNA